MNGHDVPQRASGLRVLRVVTFVNSLAIVALAGLLLLAFHTIQASRADGIRQSCVAQNARHDKTVRALDVLIRQAQSEGGREARRAARGRTSTLLLINALAPRADCDRRAKQLTN